MIYLLFSPCCPLCASQLRNADYGDFVGRNRPAGRIPPNGFGSPASCGAIRSRYCALRLLALREVGQIERTLFMLEWMQDPELRRRVQIGLNKGEARNALARAVFFNRLGEMRDRSFENQNYRAGGLNLVVAAIILWNTVYLERAIAALKKQGNPIREDLILHISPLAWEHINLTEDYVWRLSRRVAAGRFRPLRKTGQ